MTGIRRGYIYLVTLISLQALTWGLINLLQNLLVFSRQAGIASETNSLSWQIAIIIVTLPVFMVHWLWAQRLAAKDRAEQCSWVRGLYLQAIVASFLIPALAYSYNLLRFLFQLLIQGEQRINALQLTPGDEALSYLLPFGAGSIAVLSLSAGSRRTANGRFSQNHPPLAPLWLCRCRGDNDRDWRDHLAAMAAGAIWVTNGRYQHHLPPPRRTGSPELSASPCGSSSGGKPRHSLPNPRTKNIPRCASFTCT